MPMSTRARVTLKRTQPARQRVSADEAGGSIEGDASVPAMLTGIIQAEEVGRYTAFHTAVLGTLLGRI